MPWSLELRLSGLMGADDPHRGLRDRLEALPDGELVFALLAAHDHAHRLARQAARRRRRAAVDEAATVEAVTITTTLARFAPEALGRGHAIYAGDEEFVPPSMIPDAPPPDW